MTTTLWAIALVLAGLLMAFTVYAAVIGVVGAFTGQGFTRCPRCHRYGLTPGERLHDEGCPPGIVERIRQGWPHHVHVRHN